MCAQATHAAQIARRERTQGGKKDRKHKGGELTQSDTSSGSAAARVLLPALFLCVSRSRLGKASLFESNNKKNCRLKRELDSADCFGEWGGHRPVEERTIHSRGQGSREVHCDARREAPEVWWRPQIANQHTVENVRPRHGSSQRHVVLEIRQGERNKSPVEVDTGGTTGTRERMGGGQFKSLQRKGLPREEKSGMKKAYWLSIYPHCLGNCSWPVP
jgi:hypothetical protein